MRNLRILCVLSRLDCVRSGCVQPRTRRLGRRGIAEVPALHVLPGLNVLGLPFLPPSGNKLHLWGKTGRGAFDEHIVARVAGTAHQRERRGGGDGGGARYGALPASREAGTQRPAAGLFETLSWVRNRPVSLLRL